MNGWKDVPQWANWRSVDKNGTVKFFNGKPSSHNGYWLCGNTLDMMWTSEERELLNQYQLDNWPSGMSTERPKAKEEDYYGMELVETKEMKRAKQQQLKSKYNRLIKGQMGASAVIDVYDVLKAFEVHNPAIQHAVKKLLATGQRGYKDRKQDISEAIDSLCRALDLEG